MAHHKRGEGPRPKLAVRLEDEGLARVDRLVISRAAAEGRKVGKGPRDMNRSVMVRRMLRYAVQHMPEDFDAATLANG